MERGHLAIEYIAVDSNWQIYIDGNAEFSAIKIHAIE